MDEIIDESGVQDGEAAPLKPEALNSGVLASIATVRQLIESGAYSVQEGAQWLIDSHPQQWPNLEAAAAAIGPICEECGS